MKSLPRIYSLSTLGLIHHQEFDYLFHPTRTDFNGDSGTGKSMIADLLQLIFVGSDAFISATASNEPRTVDGMVLRTAGKGTDLGYAFLNIEIEEGKFICVGAYLESISSHTQSFIIQTGYDFGENAKLQPFDKPLNKDILLDNNQILPIDQLKEKLEQNGFVLESWQRPKQFHSILFNNNILPIDLTSGEKTLKDYAGIIRSFSRGKSLETQKSDSLKEFLFGKEKGKEILGKYKQALHDLKSVHSDYDRNIDEIKKITAKQRELVKLKDEKEKRDTKWEELKIAELVYWSKHESQTYKRLDSLLFNYEKGKAVITELKSIITQEKENLRVKSSKLISKAQEAEDKYIEVKAKYNKLEKVLSWLQLLKCDANQLKEKYNNQKENITHKKNIKALTDLLQSKGLLNAYIESKWSDGLKSGNDFYDKTYPSLIQDIEDKNALLEFSDLTNKESLGYWAFNQKRPLSLEEESAVIHFQNLPRNKPEEKKSARYLPNVSEVFSSLKNLEKGTAGFWLNLNGIIEFIPFVKKQLLNVTDSTVVKKHFEETSTNLKIEKEKLVAQKTNLENLKSIIEETEGINDKIKSFKIRQDIKEFQEITDLNLSEEEFSSYYSHLTKQSEITLDFEKCEKEHKNAGIEKSDNEIALRDLAAIEKQITSFTFDDSIVNNIRSTVEELNKEIKIKGKGEVITEIDDDIVTSIRNIFNREKESIPASSDLSNTLGLYLSSKTKRLKSTEEYQKLRKEAIKIEDYTDQFDNQPSDADWITAERTYDAHFDVIVNTYLIEDSYKFEQVKDFVELSKSLLPDAFQKENISEEGIIENITHYLTNINEKNRQLNSRKLQKIKDLIEEVSDTVSTYLNTVRNIDNFFKDKDKQISGGYQVRLERDWSPEYKKDWMDRFLTEVESEELNNKLIDYSSLEDKMKAAFHACGGSVSVTPILTKLLDPNSYYDLSFTMKAPDGRTNKGSTGQTYAAIALLCVARLSLIGAETGKQDPGIRFMPIDEAEGLGSNYDMLYEIAKNNDYQIISLSIGPVGKFKEGEQYVYMLHKNMEESDPVNYTPMAVFSKKDIINSADKIIEDEQ